MKRLYRSRENRKLSGVLGGLSNYLGIDASMLRILYFILFIFTGFFPLAIIYFACIFIVPDEVDVL